MLIIVVMFDFAQSSERTIRDRAERINVLSGTNVFVSITELPRSIGMNHTKNYGCESLTFL